MADPTNAPPLGLNSPTGTWTFATLPASGYPVGTTLYTSDRGNCTFGVGGWTVGTPATSFVKAKRAANIAAFLAGSPINAPAWQASTAVVAGQNVTIPTGQILTYTTAGTTGAVAPVYSATVLTGRSLADGTAVAYGVHQTNGATSLASPTVTLSASAAAAGLTEYNFISGSLSPLLTCFGGVLTRGGYQNAAAPFTFANGAPPGTGNATSLATGVGYSSAYSYNNFDSVIEFYQTDSVVGITFVGSTSYQQIEIDGVLIEGAARLLNGTAGQCLKFDFGGVVKRRQVRVYGCTSVGSNALRGAAITTIGFIEATDSPNDQMLLLGDSILGTISNPAPLQPVAYTGMLIKKYLGLAGVINASVGGSGYIAQLANTFNTINLLSNPVNAQLIQGYAPGHVLIAQGYNDIGTTPSLVAAAALATWQAIRALLPNAKITVTDGFSQATGPSAAAFSQAAALQAMFYTWDDPNSRFIQSTGTAAGVSYLRGTGTASGALVAGNSCVFVGTDNVHPTPLGSQHYGYRLAAAVNYAWNGEY